MGLRQWTQRIPKSLFPTITLAAVISFTCAAIPARSAELTTAFQESYPKYYQPDSQLENKVEGLCIDIIRAIEKESAITISAPQGFLPFKRLQSELAKGNIDLFIGMARNRAREEQYIFIDTPLYEVNHVIAARRDDAAAIHSFDDIRALAPDNIILTNLGTATEKLLKAQPGLNVDSEGRNLEANLTKLLYGRGRFICFHDIGLVSAIKRYGHTGEIKVFPTSFKKYHHYIAFAPTTQKEIIALIDKAVQKLVVNGELERIRLRYVNSTAF